MVKSLSPEMRLADCALKELAKKPWREISLASVARAAKVPLKELPLYASAKPQLIALVLKRLGDEVTTHYKPDRKVQSARDRLFDVAMAWFDVAGRHKPALRALYEGLRSDPFTLVDARGGIIAAGEWLMTLAEADKGPALALRAGALAAVMGRAIPVWLKDDRDLTKTMARLDGDLRRGESWLGKL